MNKNIRRLKFSIIIVYIKTNWSVLNSLELLCMLISKLATSSGDNCNRKVQSIHRWHKREPDLAELIHFIDEETQLVNDPLYSWEAVQQCADKKEKDKKSSCRSEKRIRTLATQINQQAETKIDEKDKKGAVSCPCCSKSHDLEQCKPCLDKSIDDRSKFLASK